MDSFAFTKAVPLLYFYHLKNELLYNILIKPSLVVTLYVLDKNTRKFGISLAKLHLSWLHLEDRTLSVIGVLAGNACGWKAFCYLWSISCWSECRDTRHDSINKARANYQFQLDVLDLEVTWVVAKCTLETSKRRFGSRS